MRYTCYVRGYTLCTVSSLSLAAYVSEGENEMRQQTLFAICDAIAKIPNSCQHFSFLRTFDMFLHINKQRHSADVAFSISVLANPILKHTTCSFTFLLANKTTAQ